MSINPFKLERYFAKYEFKVKYLLSASDCECLATADLLEMATEETTRLWRELRLGYTESQGHPLLRDEIEHLYQSITADHVLVAVPEEAIFICMQTMLKPDDHIIAISPAYQSLHEVARSIGCNLTLWNFNNTRTGWQLDFEFLERSLTPQTRLLVINFPHNPTGYLPSQQEYKSVIEFARKHSLYVFSDEMYRLLEYEPDATLPAMCDAYEKGISLSGLSKSFALPGLRLGWLATQDAGLLDAWLTYKDYTTICNSAPGEILGIMALQAKEKIIQRNLEIVHFNIQTAANFFNKWETHFDWLPPQAGSIAFPNWKGKIPVEEFCQGVLDQCGVMIVPGSIFDFPGNHFRVGLGRKNFPEAIEQVSGYLSRKH